MGFFIIRMYLYIDSLVWSLIDDKNKRKGGVPLSRQRVSKGLFVLYIMSQKKVIV